MSANIQLVHSVGFATDKQQKSPMIDYMFTFHYR